MTSERLAEPDTNADAAVPVEDPSTTSAPDGPDDEAKDTGSLLEQEGDIAADYLETLLDIADLDGDIDIDVERDRAAVSIVGDGLGNLIGRGGATLEALQELTRLAVHRETGVRSRLMLDIGGYRAQRRLELVQLATTTAVTVASTGESTSLAPMSAFERKVVHDAIASIDGVETDSSGEEPARYVVISPA